MPMFASHAVSFSSSSSQHLICLCLVMLCVGDLYAFSFFFLYFAGWGVNGVCRMDAVVLGELKECTTYGILAADGWWNGWWLLLHS